MHIELIDLLRCPNDHDETWLVAALHAVEDRLVVKAKLGCPICGASYVIAKGIADLRSHHEPISVQPGHADPDSAIRLAALLNLTRPGSFAILQGTHASAANQVTEMTQSRVIGLNSAAAVDDTELAAAVFSDSRIPLATDSVDGLALDEEKFLHDAARVLRQGGRLVIPAEATLPYGITEVARDAQNIVGEAIGQVITLRR